MTMMMMMREGAACGRSQRAVEASRQMVVEATAAAARRVDAARQRPAPRQRRMSQLSSGQVRDQIVDVHLPLHADHQQRRRTDVATCF